MIRGLFHPGSGLGNQLHRYVAVRILAERKGYEWGMVNPEGFKGKSFIKLNMGKPNNYPFHIEEPAGKIVVDMPSSDVYLPLWEENTPYYNPDFNFIKDFTIVDGNFEDERYFEDNLYKVKDWLRTNPVHIPNDMCVIGFRGGEYYTVPELGLPKEYYDRAIEIMKSRGVHKFEVHTDDVELAQKFFPEYRIIRDVEKNWQAVRYAENAIIANSSFYVLPRLLNGGLTIAPRYWNRYNTKKWEYPQNYYKEFMYI